MTSSRIVLKADEAAELIQIHPNTLRRLAKQGAVPARKVGKEWRFNKIAILDWLAGEHTAVKINDDEMANTSWRSEKTPKLEFGKLHLLSMENAIKEAQAQQLKSTRRNKRLRTV